MGGNDGEGQEIVPILNDLHNDGQRVPDHYTRATGTDASDEERECNKR